MLPKCIPEGGKIGSKSRFRQRGGQGSPHGVKIGPKIMKIELKLMQKSSPRRLKNLIRTRRNTTTKTTMQNNVS